MKEYILYGIPKGETDRYTEVILSTQCKTPAEIDAMKERASADGWHSFRVAIYGGEAPDFGKVIK